MSQLREALEDAIGGRCRAVLVTGEAGIGKSRLLEELASEAVDVGCLTLSGRGAEFETDVPFAILIDAIDSYLCTLDAQDVDRMWVDRLGALASVFPALERLGSAVDVPVNVGERFRVHRAIGELIERLAARRPVVLVLDDLHWADAASLEVAAHLARRPPEGAILIAFGVRSGPGPERIMRSLASIETADPVTTVPVPPSDRSTIAALVGGRPGEADRWYEMTRGNPFFALQLARADLGPRRGFDLDDVPLAVQGAIRSELDALPERARVVAAVAAAVGDPFDIDLVIGTGEVTEDDVLAGLDDLGLHGVIRSTSAPRIFEFRHPLVRSAIYQMTPPGTRIARHGLIADYLRRRGAGPTQVARHVEHSARHGDQEAIGVLTQAAGAVMAQAPVSAIRWLTIALSLLPTAESPLDRIGLLGQLATAQGAVGDLAGGLDALRRSLAIVPPDDPTTLARVATACAEGERLLSQPDAAARTLRLAYERIPDPNTLEASRLAIARSTTAFYQGNYRDALAWADEAVRVAEARHDGSLILGARSARLAGAAFSGQLVEARRLQAQLSREIDRLTNADLVDQLDALATLSVAEMYLDLYEPAFRHATRGLDVSRRSGTTHLLPAFSPVAGTAAWTSGGIGTAIEILDDAVESARQLDNDAVLAWHLFNRALVDLVLGDVESALAITAESWALAEPLAAGMIPALAAAGRARALGDAGRPVEAIELLYTHGGGPDLSLLGGGLRGMWLDMAVRWHLELGDAEGALGAARRARAGAEEVPVDMAMMSADRAEAANALATAEAMRAVELSHSALARAESMGSPVYMAWCREDLGRALDATGDREAALRELSAASERYDEIGAVRHRDNVDSVLRRLGRTVHRRSRPGRGIGGLESLTGRELELAELIRSHATNREIANELFLSMKTVETHVRNIFNKLGVASRAEIARTLAASDQR